MSVCKCPHMRVADLRMSRRLNEEKAAMNTSVLDVSFPLRCEFLAQVCRVLILDVFDDGIPARNCQLLR